MKKMLNSIDNIYKKFFVTTSSHFTFQVTKNLQQIYIS